MSAIKVLFVLAAVTANSVAFGMGPDPGGHTGDGVTPTTTKTGQPGADAANGSSKPANKIDESTGPTNGSKEQRDDKSQTTSPGDSNKKGGNR